jgi:hypothetical protein
VVPRAVKNPPEAQLYELLLTTLKTDWVREMEIEPYHIVFEITASQRKNLVRGRWIQPDITAVSVRTFRHIPNKYVDVWTFEVKAVESLDVKSVFEAAAHASRATRSYALLQVPDDESNPYDDVLERCEREATRLGVGLITFSTPGDFKTWETRVEAPRLETAPEVLDEFVGHLTQGVKDRIATWK